MLGSPHTRCEMIVGGIFIFIVLVHAALRIIVKVRQARARSRGEVHQREIFGRMMAAAFALLAMASIEWAARLWRIRVGITALGLILYAISGLLQWRAFQDLGSAYSPDIEVRSDQPLVQSGLYGLIRHPLLAALILEMLGIVMFLNAYMSLALTSGFFIPLVLRRLKEEEKVLHNHFGETYARYCEKVGALWPKFAWGVRHDS
jgi:protein-S-isoprenylcysteine O-methyltransferase Ste14